MPEISLLEPTVLRGLVEKFTAPESLELLNRFPKTPWPFPAAQWEIVRGSRNIGRPNVPNSEAHIVPKLGRENASASFVYYREKKVFEPTTIHWIKTPGTLAEKNAEAAVLREVGDLNTRLDNFTEWTLWQCLQGSLVLDYEDVQTVVDYKVPASHKVTSSTGWPAATPQQIMSEVIAWKRLIQRDGRVAVKQAYLAEETLQDVFNAFALEGSNPGFLLSDRMKDQFYSQGTLPNFLGIDWTIQGAVYDATGASYGENPTDPNAEALFLPQGKVLFVNLEDNRPVELMVGPTADDEAPEGFTGKFTKTWKDKDPSARQVLIEYNFLPVLRRPDQVVVADVSAH